ISRSASSYVPPPSNPPLVNSAPVEEEVVAVNAASAAASAPGSSMQMLTGIGVMPIPRVNVGIVASRESSVADSESDYSASDAEDLDVPAFIRKRGPNV